MSRKPVRRDATPRGVVYSHLSEEERQIIQIEIGNGTGIRAIGAMLGRSASTISRQIKRNTWLPSNENGSYRLYRPKRLKTGLWTGRHCIAGPAQRKAGRRRMKPRKPHRLSYGRDVDAGGRMAGMRPLSAADRRQVACPVAG
uniref:helix-turn-helix domain-containing protein n=1 Tax=Bifidobacterium pseudolongum TaxID=1694 RepID=UPI00214AD87D|nr:helix-turn-helix domain-containing protein [Bifidobacterium pseudolongum]